MTPTPLHASPLPRTLLRSLSSAVVVGSMAGVLAWSAIVATPRALAQDAAAAPADAAPAPALATGTGTDRP